MVDLPLPLLSAPGRLPQAAGGRLINCYPEKLPATAGKGHAYWRVPGLSTWGTTAGSGFRGMLVVGSLLYAVIGTSVYSFPSTGGAGTVLTGSVTGTLPCTLARDNASTPHIVIVCPGEGAFVISGTTVSTYPDSDVGSPNSVVFHKGFFLFTYGDGKTRSTSVNSTSVATTDVATAESKPDTLYRAVPLGNGQYLLAGSSTMEVWGGQVNDTGYPFSYIATIGRGIVGPYAITGDQDGWGLGIFIVGDNYRVSQIEGYNPVPISTPDVDLAIEREADKSLITIGCYMAQGHGFVVVQAPTWCWEYDTTLQTWHERQSYLKSYWRGLMPIKAFDKWLCGDTETGNILQIDGDTKDEVGNPIRARIETGPLGGFPKTIRVNAIELYLTKGVGIATGDDPVQTDPVLEVSCSLNGGNKWSLPRQIAVGRQAITKGRVRSSGMWGQADVQGVRWRFDFSADVEFAVMGADMKFDALQ